MQSVISMQAVTGGQSQPGLRLEEGAGGGARTADNKRILIVEPAGAVEMLVSIMGLTPLPVISRTSVRRQI